MPLTFDMPLEELRTYKGTNPRPADFDEYWSHALLEMSSVAPDVELVPAAFECGFADCFDLYFTGVGGARIRAKLARPTLEGPPAAAVIQFHGYTGRSYDWSDQLQLVLAAEGIVSVTMDCRGQGGQSQDTGQVSGTTMHGHIVRGLSDALNGQPEKLLYRSIFLDAAQLAGIVMDMPEVDAGRVGARGLSQGGALTLACAALEPRIRLIAPTFPFLCDYQRVWEIDQAKQAYDELAKWFRDFDPRHEQERAVFEALGYIDVQHLADRIRADVHWTTALMDTVTPPSTQFAAYNKLKVPKSMDLYPDYTHERLPELDDHQFKLFRQL